MNSVRIKAAAKLNLTLHITGRENGYHMLDSIVTTVDLYDVIKIKKRRDKLVFITMHGLDSESIPHEKNNAVIAAEKYIEKFGTCGADITIYKNIPMGAGLGGSSADAAGVLNGMSKLYGLGSFEEISALADEVGSDVRFLLGSGFARMRGRGEKVEYIDSKLKLDFLLLIPKSGVSTAECYKRYDALNCERGTSDGAYEAILNSDKLALSKHIQNDLEGAAVTLNGDIEEELKRLAEFDPLAYGMTGSGSAVFALFENKEFCDYAKSRYRGRAKALRIKNY